MSVVPEFFLLAWLFISGGKQRELWDEEPVATSKASVAAFHTVPLQLAWLQNQHRLFVFSLCFSLFHWLQSAFLQFFHFLGSQLALVNTNNINASDFCHSCDKTFSHRLSCGFSLQLKLMTLQPIPHNNTMQTADLRLKYFIFPLTGNIFFQRPYYTETVFAGIGSN